MADILKALQEEKSRLTQQMETVDAALKLYGGSVSSGRKGKKRGPMSAATKRKLKASQRKRWAKFRAEQKAKKTKKTDQTKEAA